MHVHRASACAIALLAVLLRPSTAAHFDCSSIDDVKGEVQDASGYVCGSKCAPDTFNCPTDVPVGTSAQPQCMLQDVDRTSFCGLLCQVDSQCPNGARCSQMKQVEVGICLYPVSFSDWAKLTSNRKFSVGWPTRAGASSGTSGSFQIAKTYAALQSLKSKYSIDDGDADMLTLKELLSSMTASSSAVAASGAVGGGPGSPASRAGGGGSTLGAWNHDITNFEGYVGDGIPGLERELHDTVWNIEHPWHRNAYSALLRGIILLAFAYVSVGSFFKYQMGARGMDVIPHVSFWMEYPNMVGDGVTYSKILLGMQGGSGGSSGDLLSGGIRSSGAGAFETL